MAIFCLVILEIYTPDIVHYGSTEFINSICNHYKKNPGFLSCFNDERTLKDHLTVEYQ